MSDVVEFVYSMYCNSRSEACSAKKPPILIGDDAVIISTHDKASATLLSLPLTGLMSVLN